MSRIPSTSNSPTTQQATGKNALNELDLDVFLKLMIAELQNQDPLNPMENDQLLSQISQIREVGATDRLTKTLDSVLLGQNISSATNLIGADVSAISDENERVEGIVNRVSIENGNPKLHVELGVGAAASDEPGEVDAGKHSYRVVWEDASGRLIGLELSGARAITTTATNGVDTSIVLSNLPVTAGQKQVYRTDATGEGPYQLVGVIPNGSQGSFVDRLSDEARSETRQTVPFQRTSETLRSHIVSLNKVSAIRPPVVPIIPQDAAATGPDT